MKIHIVNKLFPNDPKYSRIVNSQLVPRVGDHVDVGYNPPPVVTKVVWRYDNDEVYVAVE